MNTDNYGPIMEITFQIFTQALEQQPHLQQEKEKNRE